MLFNSYIFIFMFLPITLFLFFYAAKYSQQSSLTVLLVASLIFYGWCDYHYLIILFFSIITNFFIGRNILSSTSLSVKKNFLWLGIIFNLGLLGYFKYYNFFIENINHAFHAHLQFMNLIMPIGISFFTFTQIAFLVDSYRGLVEKYRFLSYALFVTYFPHLIAGPIIHHKEVMPQFEKKKIFEFNNRNFLLGLTIFTIGLFKKVVLADYLVYFVTPIFDVHLNSISFIDAWTGALAYTFELYFDFSGYSDMAIGLSLLIGIKLPVNFYSPYKAKNIIEFWRRWNMTLSRFLRDYLYIPLGGNRNGPTKRYVNLMATMLLGGLWHGANWTFVIWGMLHGFYLCVNHAWLSLKRALNIKNNNNYLVAGTSWVITFLSVVIAWVFFRSPDYFTAKQILHAMFFEKMVWQDMAISPKFIVLMSLSFCICGFMPNTYQFLSKFKPALLPKEHFHGTGGVSISWKPTLIWNFLMAMMFVLGIMFIQISSTFLYFRF